MKRFPWPQRPELRVLVVVSVLVLLIQGLAVWAITAGRQRAHQELRQELELLTQANARSLEALLATLRGDCLSIVHSPLSARFTATRTLADTAAGASERGALETDPVARRWSRLDVEAMLLLFLQANPAVERAVLTASSAPEAAAHQDTSAGGTAPDTGTTVLAGRRNGVPELLPPDVPLPLKTLEALDPAGDRDLVVGTWPLPNGRGSLHVWLRPRRLLEIVAPGFEDLLTIETSVVPAVLADVPATTTDAGLVARQPVSDAHWQPPLAWTLVRRQGSDGLRASVEELTGRLGMQAGLSLALMVLVLLLGSVAIRQVRRAARFEAEAEQQARVRHLERQLAHSHRLASVGRLAAGIAHEINNPLAGMTNHLALLDDDLRHGDTDGASQQVARVRDGLQRIGGIVRRVLTAATPDTTPPDEPPRPPSATWDSASPGNTAAPGERLDLRRVVRDTASFVSADPGHGCRDLHCDLPASAIEVQGDEVALGQLVLNLLLNACACEDCSRIDLQLRAEHGEAHLRVLDDGGGFSNDALEHVFEPFFSTRGSSGLGLAVCRGIVHDHGGTIEASNLVGARSPDGKEGKRGAVVEVRLPLAQRREPRETGATA